jgi:pectin methylesterase-like acyl-CoA thioesterase
MADRRTEARAVVLAVLMLVSMVGVGFTGSGAGTYASVSPDSMTENEHPFTTQDTESTIVVDGNGGGDYTTIQSGVDNATDGDTVEVRPGTYSEQVVLEKTSPLSLPTERRSRGQNQTPSEQPVSRSHLTV